MNKFSVIIATISISVINFLPAKNDIGLVRKNLQEITMYYTDYSSYNFDSTLLRFNTKTGTFDDLNYMDNTASVWHWGTHWKRITEMAIRYSKPESKNYHSFELKEKVLKAVDYWFANYTRPKNAWWELIGVPNEMVKVFILMETELGTERLQKAIPQINLAIRPDMYYYHGAATGQNLLWETFIHIYSSVLTGDTVGLKRAYQTSANEIVITKLEGIQPDFSFHQHGAQSYAFGYGRAFSLSAAQILFSAKGTSYALPTEKTNIVSAYMLDGQQWCSQHKMLEYTAMGREISRPEAKTGSIILAAELMAKTDTERKAELVDFISQLKGEKRKKDLMGNRYFPRIDFMVQHGRGFMFTAKAVSKDIVSTEAGNDENLKAYHLGRGTQFIVRRGDEYEGIFPLWDWEKIPGSLCEQTGKALPIYSWTKGAEGNTSFVLGVSNGRNGCFTYDYNKDNVQAHRSWFCFDGEIVVLVSGLNNATQNLVFQSINQSFSTNNIFVNSKRMADEAISKKNIQSVWHDSTAYIFQKSRFNITVSNKTQTGSWEEINKVRSSKMISKKIFTLGIDLGQSNQNASFSYIIIPNVGANNIQSLERKPEIKILENSKEKQIVWNMKNDILQAVTYKSCVIKLPWKRMRLLVEMPGVLVIQKSGTQIEITYQTDKNTRNQIIENVSKRKTIIL